MMVEVIILSVFFFLLTGISLYEILVCKDIVMGALIGVAAVTMFVLLVGGSAPRTGWGHIPILAEGPSKQFDQGETYHLLSMIEDRDTKIASARSLGLKNPSEVRVARLELDVPVPDYFIVNGDSLIAIYPR